ncbi:hypothetical protein BaRGS_00002749 [Batillaria attramentaria]|uniref:Uncharacterized protein n=1 Tax=Batillaria attramentaria TaxID=370345 RepID=A0ABD0M2V1_9CAEN
MAKPSRNSWVIWLALFIMILDAVLVFAGPPQYNYKHYTYRKKRDDKKYRNARQRCDMTSECQGIYGVEHTKCVRMCISEICYNELYGDDPLEEGEVDVRLNSFKGCLSQVAVADF